MNFFAVLARVITIAAAALFAISASAAIDPQAIRDLAFGESDAKLKAIGALAARGDPEALPLLQALLDGDIQTVGEDQVLLVKGGGATELLSGKTVSSLPESRDDIVINNRVRKGLGTAIAALKLSAPSRAVRLAAAKELQSGTDEDMLPAISDALARETDAEVKELLTLTRASIQLASTDKTTRRAAIRALGDSSSPSTKTLLLGVLEKKGRQLRRARSGAAGRGREIAARRRRQAR